MTWDAIGAIGELVGAAGVLLSIIYLALQVKQNTEENRVLRGQTLVTGIADASALIADNPDLSAIVRNGMLDFDSLDETERFRFSFVFFSIMAKYDFSYHQKLAGRIDPNLWTQTDYEIATFVNLPGLKRWWEKDKLRFTVEFRGYVDDALASRERSSEVPVFGFVDPKDGA